MSWDQVESQLSTRRGTLVYSGSGVNGRVWWTADEEIDGTENDAIANALLVDCPRRYRSPANLLTDFPNARINEFSGSALSSAE